MSKYGDKIAKLGEGTVCAYELFDRGIERKRTTFKLWLRDCLPETRVYLAELMTIMLTNYHGINFGRREMIRAKNFIASYNPSTFGMKEGLYACILEIRFTQKRNHERLEQNIIEAFNEFVDEIGEIDNACD